MCHKILNVTFQKISIILTIFTNHNSLFRNKFKKITWKTFIWKLKNKNSFKQFMGQ